mmetsp:Transcript_3448/g.6862  ORF Transcript_3448/g.6862 Transcript_3448/m.6862 type:complete len:81 (-) Transcript_3448:3054-3296(-)
MMPIFLLCGQELVPAVAMLVQQMTGPIEIVRAGTVPVQVLKGCREDMMKVLVFGQMMLDIVFGQIVMATNGSIVSRSNQS